MTRAARMPGEEPVLAVGLVSDAQAVTFWLMGDFADEAGRPVPEGEYRAECRHGILRCSGPRSLEAEKLLLLPKQADRSRFSIEATIGLRFHWQKKEVQAFAGALRLVPVAEDLFHAINDVALETYLTSVICSEMDAASPAELIKAHSVISRSWLLAQRERGKPRTPPEPSRLEPGGERIRWYDREAHGAFDVCADDHCQRYHGLDRVGSSEALRSVRETRGQALVFAERVCDARYSKCCGGVTEDFRVAWAEEEVPYLVPVVDAPGGRMPFPPLTGERAAREHIKNPPDAHCNCADERILTRSLTPRDRETRDFFRWETTLGAEQAGQLAREKLDLDLGRILSLEPVERGLSGRLKRLRLVGERGSVVVGKELEIRRVLSPTHLYSSAFVVDAEGPRGRPDRFLLRGAGWGHGVGLCQIGAAVMACRGIQHQDILRHYYPGTRMDRVYP